MGYLVIFFVLGIALGLLLGYSLGQWHEKKDNKAPMPDYDVNNPINGGSRRGETVQICGHTFWRIN